MKFRLWPLLILWALLTPSARAQDALVVGSKAFTESVILGEMATQLLVPTSPARHQRELGGTRILFDGLQAGAIDVYPDYTGTLMFEVFAGAGITTPAQLRAELAGLGLGMTDSLGFSNSYAVAMRRDQAEALGISKISDLADHPSLAIGWSSEFMDRADGWRALRSVYDLPQTNVRGMQQNLAYRGLEAGAIDVMDAYATDPEIAARDLVILEDDRGHFPPYEAVFVYRLETVGNQPASLDALRRLEGAIDRSVMARINAEVTLERRAEAAVASRFLQKTLAIAPEAGGPADGWVARLVDRGLEHLLLVGVSMLAALLVAIPLGVQAWRRPTLGRVILQVTGVLQTIPSLALLVLMIPLLGIGLKPTIAALFLYSLLPIVRNTHAGLQGIEPGLEESALALGLPAGARLRLIQLPLALPFILAGIKTAVVINVGTATLGALVGSGGFGQPILTGIRLNDTGLILEGALPAALLALLATAAFEGLERLLVAPPLRGGVTVRKG